MSTRNLQSSAVVSRRVALCVAGALLCGCDSRAFLNPAFVNSVEGGLFPLVPEPGSGLLFVRVVNTTSENIRFTVTIERAAGGGGTGEVTNAETIDLFTQTGAQSNESGVVFDCTEDNPILRVGLGEDLNRPSTDPGLFVGVIGDITAGFGVPANINPLNAAFNDFQCGDTVIFQAIAANSEPGGFRVNPFVLPHELQPDDTVRDTFQVTADFLRGRPSEE